jgi:hypothetical protein
MTAKLPAVPSSTPVVAQQHSPLHTNHATAQHPSVVQLLMLATTTSAMWLVGQGQTVTLKTMPDQPVTQIPALIYVMPTEGLSLCHIVSLHVQGLWRWQASHDTYVAPQQSSAGLCVPPQHE